MVITPRNFAANPTQPNLYHLFWKAWWFLRNKCVIFDQSPLRGSLRSRFATQKKRALTGPKLMFGRKTGVSLRLTQVVKQNG